MKYSEWLAENKESLKTLFQQFQAETGDTVTTFEHFCRHMYGETIYVKEQS